MIKIILFYIQMFFPLFLWALLYYTWYYYFHKESRRFQWPYLIFALKELIKFYFINHYGVRSLYFLYTTRNSPVPMYFPALMYALDIIVFAIWSLSIFKYLEIKKRLSWLYGIGVIGSALLFAVLEIMSYPIMNVLLLRIVFGLAIGLTFLALQKGYFESGVNSVIRSKVVLSVGILFLLPSVFLNLSNVHILGQIFNILFYAFISAPVFYLSREVNLRLNDELDMLERERNVIEKLLHGIGQSLASNEDQKSILNTIIKFAMDATSARAGSILLLNKRKTHLKVEVVEGFFPPVTPVDSMTASKEKFLVEKFKQQEIEIGQSYLGKVAQTQEPLFIQNALENEVVVQSAKGVMDILSVIALPLKVEDEVLGVLALLNKTNEAVFSEGDFALAQSLSDQAAVALNTVKLRNEYQEKLQSEKELAVAGQIQQGLLPTTFPEFPNLEIYAFSKAAKGVGGDYYDIIPFEDDRLGVVMADVAGKGVPAALVMVMIRSAIHTIATGKTEPKDILYAVNNGIAGEVTQERYATGFYFVYDQITGMLSYSNAGHGPMLIYRAMSNTFELLDTAGLPVGIARDTEYGQDETILNTGDIALLYTDGITEAMNLKHDEYTLARVKEDIRSLKDSSAKEIVDEIIHRITEFAGDAPQHDDETIVVLKAK